MGLKKEMAREIEKISHSKQLYSGTVPFSLLEIFSPGNYWEREEGQFVKSEDLPLCFHKFNYVDNPLALSILYLF